MTLASVLLLALVAGLAVVKVQAARRCEDILDCDEGYIEKSWTGAECSGEFEYRVIQRANETGCLPSTEQEGRWHSWACNDNEHLVKRTYIDSACTIVRTEEQTRLGYCFAKSESYCSKASASGSTQSERHSPADTSVPQWNSSKVDCATGDAECIAGTRFVAVSSWTNSSECQPRATPDRVFHDSVDIGSCYLYSSSSNAKVTCEPNWVVTTWYSNGCNDLSWYSRVRDLEALLPILHLFWLPSWPLHS